MEFRSPVIDEIEAMTGPENIGLAYVYLDYKSHDEQSINNVLSSLLRQLMARKDDAIPAILGMYRHFFSGQIAGCQDRPGATSLLEGIALVSTHFCSTFIVLDALDEFDENLRSNLLDMVGKLIASVSSAKLYATSRPHLRSVQDFFEDFPRVEIRADINDIKNYLTKTIEGKVSRGTLRNTIIDKVSISAKGM